MNRDVTALDRSDHVDVPALGRAASTGSAITALAFTIAVAMWAIGYVLHLPLITGPGWLTVIGLVAALLIGGFVGGKSAGLRPRSGAVVGVITGLINLMILGSLLAEAEAGRRLPSALIWVPGSLIASGLLVAIGVALGRRSHVPGLERNWTGRFAAVAVVATGLLLIAGGLVTGADAGLAVPDWPQSFGSNMFLYPLSRMTGAVYYEHAHRLYGALVGLTTVALAVHLWIVDRRRWLRVAAVIAVIAVIAQGILGGLRVETAVTGDGVTYAGPEHETAVSTALRVAHGTFGQLFFALMVFIAAACSNAWRTGRAMVTAGAATDRQLAILLLAALIVQLILGAFVRHLAAGLLLHITFATAVIMLAVAVGARNWAMQSAHRPLRRLGRLLTILIGVQLILGIGALGVTHGAEPGASPTNLNVFVSTMHQAVGAALLACAVGIVAFSHRLLRQATADTRPEASHGSAHPA
jgi:cytochrome c oxidase assembly protein subunit 15